jgi:hypothetical protein
MIGIFYPFFHYTTAKYILQKIKMRMRKNAPDNRIVPDYEVHFKDKFCPDKYYFPILKTDELACMISCRDTCSLRNLSVLFSPL